MKRTSYIFNLNREVSLIDLDWILTDECGKGNWEASIDMAEGDYLWLSAADEDGEKWRALGKEKTFDRAYVVIEYEEWDDPRRFIENVKTAIQERTDDEEPAEEIEEVKEVEEEMEILEFYTPENAEIKATELSQDIIYPDENGEINEKCAWVVVVKDVINVNSDYDIKVVNTNDCYAEKDSDGISIEAVNLWRKQLWMNIKRNIAEARVGSITTRI